jgi:HEAT repeat protein
MMTSLAQRFLLGAISLCVLTRHGPVHAKPMDAEAAKMIPALQRVLAVVQGGGELSDEDDRMLLACLEGGDPVLVSLAAYISGETKKERVAFRPRLEAALGRTTADMPKAFLQLAVQNAKMDNGSDAQAHDTLNALVKDPNPYLRIQAAKEVLKRNGRDGKVALRSLLADESPVARGEAARQLKKLGEPEAAIPMVDERYELVLSVIEGK